VILPVPQRRDNPIDLQVSEAKRLVRPANPNSWKKMRALQVSFKDAAMVGRNSGLVTCILNKDGFPLAASTLPAKRIRKVIDRLLKQIL
jgi:hypothetical protein